MNKKKLFITSLFVATAILLILSGQPTEALVGFIAAGAIPGMKLTINPYFSFALALIGGFVLLYKLYQVDVSAATNENEERQEKMVSSLKITSRTHHHAPKRRRRFIELEEAK